MEAKDFCYWLQGYLEMSSVKTLNEQELQILRDHLKLVFEKVTPTYTQQISQGIAGQIIQATPYVGAIC